jgi:hypothetical protein
MKKSTRINQRPSRRSERTRGNTIVLVAGILVLLVIIATSYLTRTQSQRVVTVATSEWHQFDDNAKITGEYIADDIAGRLFPWLVDPELVPIGDIADANFPRLHPSMYIERYGVEAHRYAVDWDYPYNYAPYYTVPRTNWPDFGFFTNETLWPAGPGNVSGAAGSYNLGGNPLLQAAARGYLASEYNALGNPGFGDARWLADIEPMRITLTGGAFNGAEAFSHWRKMTNLAHANNAWRIVADISDVDTWIVHDLNIPVEQWLPVRPFGLNPDASANLHQAGNTSIAGENENAYMLRWRQWFGLDSALVNPMDGYQNRYIVPMTPPLPGFPTSAPGNLINLRNPNASPLIHEPGERPQDEFNPGSLRNRVSRVLADTDGDGFTDAFWFVSPVPVRGGVRQIVAVRIIDNSAMMNANVAGRFIRKNAGESGMPGGPIVMRKTQGHGPWDLALVGGLTAGSGSSALLSPPAPVAPNNWNVGLFDNMSNWVSMQQYPNGVTLWENFLTDVGMVPASVMAWASQDQRREYWRLAGRPAMGDPQFLPGDPSFRPFNLSDEIELRMFHGNNHPWIYTRFERAVQNNASGGASPGILRGGVGNEESTEYAIASDTFFGQRSNVHLVRDLRSRITLYNGARNEQMPPWLWWENQRLNMVPSIFDDYVFPDQLTQELIERRFLTQARQKIDLREMDGLYYAQLSNAAPPSVPWPLYEDAAAAYPFQLNPYTLTNELLHAAGSTCANAFPRRC